MLFGDVALQILKGFVLLTLDVAPFFLLGAVFGAVLQTYIKADSISKYLGFGNLSVMNASVLGAVLPGCACATIPMADGLKRQGADLGTVTAFIMISPLLSPITIAMTYGMLGWEITAARVVFPFIGSIVVGVILNYLEKSKISGFGVSAPDPKFKFVRGIPVKENFIPPDSCQVEAKQSFWGNLVSIIIGLSKYFLIGMLVASVLTALVPEDSISEYIIFSGFTAYLAAAIAGIPLYVCEGQEVPITFALLNAGLGVGPAFTFLLGSVGTCIPTMIMAQKIIGRKATAFYIASWFVFAVGSGLLLSLIAW